MFEICNCKGKTKNKNKTQRNYQGLVSLCCIMHSKHLSLLQDTEERSYTHYKRAGSAYLQCQIK